MLGFCGEGFVAKANVFSITSFNVNPVVVNYGQNLTVNLAVRNVVQGGSAQQANYTLELTNAAETQIIDTVTGSVSVAGGAQGIATETFAITDSSTFPVANYKVKVNVAAGTNLDGSAEQELSDNSALPRIFSVGGQQFSPISVPDNSLALLPLIALIVVGIVLFKK